MISIAQFLIGGFWTAAVSVSSWLLGFLMGVALAKLLAARAAGRTDVDDLLKRERAAVHAARQAGPGAVPQAVVKAGGAG